MTIFEMLGQSGVLAVLGMSVVFGFLVVLVVSISLAGKLIQALGWNREEAAGAPAGGAAGTAGQGAVIAAITAAVNEYRKTENR
jgi:oxaloacetate decarboxylase gamma subunit